MIVCSSNLRADQHSPSIHDRRSRRSTKLRLATPEYFYPFVSRLSPFHQVSPARDIRPVAVIHGFVDTLILFVHNPAPVIWHP